jgi:hypothetical protein
MWVNDMNSLFPDVNSSSARGQTAGRRRFAASLLVGWFAFWLNSTVLACCAGLTQNVMSTGEAVLANGPTAELSPSDHNDPLRSVCADLTASTGVAPSAAAGPADRSDSRVAEFTAPIPGVVAPSALSSAIPRSVSPRLPHVPLYLRTARLLI